MKWEDSLSVPVPACSMCVLQVGFLHPLVSCGTLTVHVRTYQSAHIQLLLPNCVQLRYQARCSIW